MIQLILLVLGIFALFRLPRLRKLRAEEFPEIDREAFEAWRAAEKGASIWLVIATVGVFILQLVVGIGMGVAFAAQGMDAKQIRDKVWPVDVAGLILFLGLLVVSAVYGSKAKKLKDRAGIVWPRKG